MTLDTPPPILRSDLQTQTDLALRNQTCGPQYFFTLMNTLMAPVKSAESSTSVWSVLRAPERDKHIFNNWNYSLGVINSVGQHTWGYRFGVCGVEALALCFWFLRSSFLRNNKDGVRCKNGWGDHCIVCWKISKFIRLVGWLCIKNASHIRHSAATFNPFPKVIAVPSHGCEFAQVVVSAPDVHIFILRAADDEGVVMTEGRQLVT